MLFCLKNKKENIWNDVVLIYTWYIGRFGDIVGFRFSFRASYRTSVGTGVALRLPTSTPSVGIGAGQLGRPRSGFAQSYSQSKVGLFRTWVHRTIRRKAWPFWPAGLANKKFVFFFFLSFYLGWAVRDDST